MASVGAGARVVVVGSSLGGVVNAVALCAHKIRCTLLDTEARRIEAIQSGKAPFAEPGVDAALKRALKAGLLQATQTVEGSYDGATHVLICVGTPPLPDGSQDLSIVESVAVSVGAEIRQRRASQPLTVVVKSAVVPGTTIGPVRKAVERSSGKKAGKGFGLAANPDFFEAGNAMKRALRPERFVIGGFDAASTRAVASLFSWAGSRMVRTDPTTAEMAKCAAGAFAASRESLANELANLSADLGIDWATVAAVVSNRTGPGRGNFAAGVGFGGSNLPKDLKALAAAARRRGRPLALVEAALDANQRQPQEVTRMLEEEIGDLQGKRIAILGLASAPGTDDVRESRAILIAADVTEAGAEVVGYDPLASDRFALALPIDRRQNFRRAASVEEALDGADAVVIHTESEAYRRLEPALLKRRMRRPLVIDGPRILHAPKFRRAGVTYRGIGLGR